MLRPNHILKLILGPLALLAQVITLLARTTAVEARHRPSTPAFDYQQWQVAEAKRKLARNQEAYRRRQANKPKGFAGSVADLRQTQGETE